MTTATPLRSPLEDLIYDLRRYGDPYYVESNPKYTVRLLRRMLDTLGSERLAALDSSLVDGIRAVAAELGAHLEAEDAFKQRTSVVLRAIADHLDPERSVVPVRFEPELPDRAE